MKKKAKKVAKKVIKKRQPKPQTLRGILDKLDAVLNGPDMNLASQLWDVLTALRGPDSTASRRSEIKYATTAVIRRVAFPKTAAINDNMIPAVFSSDSLNAQEIRTNELVLTGEVDKAMGWHFDHHARIAFQALGLDWSAVN
jgi:hypothetical protein